MLALGILKAQPFRSHLNLGKPFQGRSPSSHVGVDQLRKQSLANSSEQAACGLDAARGYQIPRSLSGLQVNQMGPAVRMLSYLGKQGPPKEDRENRDCQSEHTLLQCPELHRFPLALTGPGAHQGSPLYTCEPPLKTPHPPQS